MAIEPYDPPPDYERPDWGVIILTGIVSVMLISGSFLLYRQAGGAWQNFRNNLTTPSLPTPRTSQPSLEFALRVPVEGRWTAAITVTEPGGSIHIYTQTGLARTEVSFPHVDTPDGVIVTQTVHYEIVVSYPSYQEPGKILTETFRFDSAEDYQQALEKGLFAIYGADLQMRRISDGESLGSAPVVTWRPDQSSPPLPGRDFILEGSSGD